MYLVPCTMYRQVSLVIGLVRPLPLFGAKPGMYALVPSLSGDEWASDSFLQVGIWSFPVRDQIRCFICLHWEIKHLMARLGFSFDARLRGVDCIPGNDCFEQPVQGLFLEQLMRDLF